MTRSAAIDEQVAGLSVKLKAAKLRRRVLAGGPLLLNSTKDYATEDQMNEWREEARQEVQELKKQIKALLAPVVAAVDAAHTVNKDHPLVKALLELADQELFEVVHDVFAIKFDQYKRKPEEMSAAVSFVRGLIQAGEVRKLK